MGFPVATLEVQPRNFGAFLSNVTPPLVPSVALQGAGQDIIPDPVDVLTWIFQVVRSGDRASDISVGWAIAPGGSPMPASTFVGGVYPSGTAAIPAGQTSVQASFQTAAGDQPSVDQFATLALTNPSGCTLGSPVSATLRLPGRPIPVQDQLAVTCPDISWTVGPASHDHAVTVTRTNSLGTYLAGTQVRVRLTGTGVNPIVAADISGGLLDTVVTFAAGETSRPFTVTTLPGSAPAADKTGRVAVSAPVGGQLAATGTQVDVTIPHAVVVPPTGVLPPEYTDMPLASMTAIPIGTKAALTSQLNAMSGRVICKTSYVQLADGFDYGGGVYTISQSGYYETVGGKNYKWPLIICGVKGSTARSKNNKASFHNLAITGDCVCIMWHAVSYPVDGTAGQTHPYMTDFSWPIEVSGKDCFVLRCWIDAARGVQAQGDVPDLTVAACDFYGAMGDDPNQTIGGGAHVHLLIGSGLDPPRPTRAHIHNNYMAQLQEINNGGECFYTGNGRQGPDDGTATTPWDVNMRDCWFYNNCIMSERAWLIYNKHATNIYRNRIISVGTWNDPAPTGNAYHMASTRGPCGKGAKIKYNIFGGGGGNGVQGWDGEFDYNTFLSRNGGIVLAIQENNTGGDGKPLMGTTNWKFRGNVGDFTVKVGWCRTGTFTYQREVLNDQFEGNPGVNIVFDSGNGITYDANGGKPVTFAANGWNSNGLTAKFSAGGPSKTMAAVGTAVKRSATTAFVRELTPPDEILPASTGVLAPTKLIWDGLGTGAGGGGGNYDLIAANMTVWWPSDTMATDYPHSFVNFIAGGGFEVKAQNSPTDGNHACLNLWHKTAPPDGDCVFTFYFTLLDANDSSVATTDGIFALFRVRQKGIAAYGADPNGWAPASYRGTATYPTPGGDLLIRDRTIGHRHSLANHAPPVAVGQPNPTMQFRLLKCDGNDNGVDDATRYTAVTPNPVPTTGDSFLFVKDVQYKLVYTRVGTTNTCVKTKISDGTTQTYVFTDPDLGPSGQAVGGWCGFAAMLGRWFRVEPVPGIPFCAAAP